MKTLNLIFISFLLIGLNSFSYAQVDYATDIQPIFNASCTSCHGGQSGVTLSSYQATMNSVGSQYGTEIVVPGEPDQSPLVDKIEPNPQFGSRMPSGGSLSSDQINLIKQWIEEGASEVATSSELITELPKGFELKGNYPNPFNPATNISFELPQAATYEVKIYTAHGALIKKITGTAAVGTTNLRVDLNNQPSGIYLYQVTANTGNEKYLLGSKRMALIK